MGIEGTTKIAEELNFYDVDISLIIDRSQGNDGYCNICPACIVYTTTPPPNKRLFFFFFFSKIFLEWIKSDAKIFAIIIKSNATIDQILEKKIPKYKSKIIDIEMELYNISFFFIEYAIK